jgi:C4-type Zn-finger protein
MEMGEKLIKKMLSTMRCGVCGEQYQLGNMEVIGHENDIWFVSIFCPSCASRSLVAAIIKRDKVPEIVTDLTEAEYARFSQSDVVRADDVLDMHNFLKDFHGDIAELLSRGN